MRIAPTLAVLAIGIASLTTVCAEKVEPLVPKRVVLVGKRLYAAKVEQGSDGRAHPVLLSVEIGQDPVVERRSLPVASLKGGEIAWDMIGDAVHAASIHEFAPRQRSVQFLRIPLKSLKPMDEVATAVRGQHRLNDVVGGIEPLANALIESEVRESGAVHHDMIVDDDGRATLAIGNGDRLTLWTQEDSGWQSSGSFEIPFSGPFRVVVQDGTNYILTASSLFRAETDGLVAVDSPVVSEARVIVSDREAGRSLVVYSSGVEAGELDASSSVALSGSQVKVAGLAAEVQIALSTLVSDLTKD